MSAGDVIFVSLFGLIVFAAGFSAVYETYLRRPKTYEPTGVTLPTRQPSPLMDNPLIGFRMTRMLKLVPLYLVGLIFPPLFFGWFIAQMFYSRRPASELVGE